MSQERNRILFLSVAYPFGVGGGSFANHAYLRAISELFGGRVDVLFADCWRQNWDNAILINKVFRTGPRSLLRTIFSPLTGEITRFSGPAKKLLQRNEGKYEAVVSNGSSIGGNIIKEARRRGIKIVTIHHNYEPEYFSDNNKGLIKFLYLPWVKKLEKKAYKNSDLNLFLTQQDMEKFQEIYGTTNGASSVIGVFEYKNYKMVSPSESDGNKRLTFIITGSLCTMQGVDGIKYFFDELYQFLPEECNVIISGRTPTEMVKVLCDAHTNVQLIPNPERISEVISSGDIYICPTRVGGGLKLRVMDGLSLGLPVLTHSCSARGYDMFYDTNYFRSFSSKEEFKKGLNEILRARNEIQRANVVDAYRKAFAYQSGLERMKFCLAQIDLR